MAAKDGKLFQNTLILSLSGGLCKLAVFFLMPVYTAALTPAQFGTADILVSTAVLLLPLVSLGMPEALFRFGADVRDPAAPYTVGGAAVLAGLLLFACFCPLFLLSSVVRPFLPLLFFYVAASVFRSYQAHALRACGRYFYYALQQLLCTLLTVFFALLFLRVLHLGVGGYLGAVITADVLTGLFCFWYLRAWRLVRPRTFSRALAGAMLRFSLPLIPAAALWWVTAVSDRFVILHYHGQALTGLYAAAGRLPALLTFALGVFMEAWHYAALREREEERPALFSRIFGMLAPALLAVALALMLAARPIVGILFSNGYGQAARYVPLLLCAAYFSCLSTFAGSAYHVRLRTVSSLATAAVAAGVNLLLNFLWIPRAGAVGAALATLFSYATMFLLRVWDIGRMLPFSFRLSKLLPAAAGMLLTAYFAARGAPQAYCTAPLSLLPFGAEITQTARFAVRRTLIFCRVRRRNKN